MPSSTTSTTTTTTSNRINPSIKDPSNAGKPELKGVSVHWLRHGFLKEVRQHRFFAGRHSKIYDIEDLSKPHKLGVIRRKGQHVQCPMFPHFRGGGSAYVHALQGDDQVGDATHMLSYSWGYTIGDIVDTLEGFCTEHHLNPKRTYIWICCLCNNQHKIVYDRQQHHHANVPTQEFEALFQSRVKSIGRVICMMAPWKNPLYLKRVWCVFEIYTASQQQQQQQQQHEEEDKNCEVFVAMPPRERKDMFDSITRQVFTVNPLYEALANTKVEEAQASVESDRQTILDILRGGRDTDEGFHNTNQAINTYLRAWLRSMIRTMHQESKSNFQQGRLSDGDYMSICNNVGLIFMYNGEYHDALHFHQEARGLYEARFGTNHHLTARVYNNIGQSLSFLGKFDEAVTFYQRAMSIEEASLGTNHVTTALSYQNMGETHRKMGRYEEALRQCRKAVTLMEKSSPVGAHHHPTTANAYKALGSVLDDMGRYEEALTEYEKTVRIQETTIGPNHADTGDTYSNIGLVLRNMGRLEEALEAQRKGVLIRETSLGVDHSDTATSYNNIGLVLYDMERYDEALVEFRKAITVQEATLGPTHATTATSYSNMGLVLDDMGLYEEALVQYRKALVVEEATLGKDHPNTAYSYHNIGAAYYQTGNYEAGLVEMNKALHIFQETLGMDHPQTKNSQDFVQMFHDAMNQG